MKLARISHFRCDSDENPCYVVIPDDMTEEQLDELVDTASNKAIKAERAAKGEAPNPPRKDTLIATMPKDATIADIDAAFEKQIQEYAAWKKRSNEGRKSFLTWLEEVSKGKVVSVSSYDSIVKVDCHWGHNHGLSMDYDEDGL